MKADEILKGIESRLRDQVLAEIELLKKETGLSIVSVNIDFIDVQTTLGRESILGLVSVNLGR